MLSPQLLGILRTYWRLARPRLYLFPGRDEDHPIDPTVLHAACRSAVKAAGSDQARHVAHAAPQFRDASSGERNRHQDHSGSARPQQSVVDGALHAGRDPYDPGDAEPARSSVAGSDAAGLRRRWDAGQARAGFRRTPRHRDRQYPAPPWRMLIAMRSRRASGSRRTARDERDHSLPDGGARRSRRGMRRMRRDARSPTTPAAIATVRSVRDRRGRNGSRRARPNFCRFPISMSSSPCRRRSPRSPSRTRPPSTRSCLARRPRR